MTDKTFIQTIWEQRYGIIVTILFHMVVLIIFLFVKLGNIRSTQESTVMIDMSVIEEAQKISVTKSAEAENQERRQARQARNIAVNKTEDRIEKYNDYKTYQVPDSRISSKSAGKEAQDLVNQAVKDIIRENNLDPNDKEMPKVQSKPIDFYKPQKIAEEQVYKGPTNIYFKLDDRKVSYLPIPVYKCKGGATVQVDIRVGQRGKVEWTTINTSGTDTKDNCFLDSAKEAAQHTRFNFSTTAVALQQGYIIYHFVAQ